MKIFYFRVEFLLATKRFASPQLVCDTFMPTDTSSRVKIKVSDTNIVTEDRSLGCARMLGIRMCEDRLILLCSEEIDYMDGIVLFH